ncbi:transposase [Exiguobacterium sp. s192]|uniref:transposase n=1 Tax=Exiguobacterium sp. s192 TaxID=2751206 RepID=UPI001BEB9BAE
MNSSIPLLEKLYCENNRRPRIDPILLSKRALLQYLFGIPSMRQTIKEIETCVEAPQLPIKSYLGKLLY